MRLSLFGDYEFLSKIMSLIGPNGKHPCLWCTISKDSMQISLLDRGQSRNRLLTTMNTDYAKFMDKGGGDSSAFYDEYIAKLREIMHLEDRETEMKDALDGSDDNTPIAKVRDRADDIKRRIKGMDEQILQKKVDADLGILSGPIVARIDEALKSHNIIMAAYHGRSFVGNDCNKYLKENVYTDITSQAVHCVQELNSNAEIIEEAYEIKDQY